MHEVNFDCLVGPTHYFGGLSFGNLASQKNQQKMSNPKKAALQGLLKMKTLNDLGFKQAILPPQLRPNFDFLANLGFVGSELQILKDARNDDEKAFLASLSSSFMWAANMATFSPKIDCLDGKSHITPANLASMLHRSTEALESYKILKQVFNDEKYFTVHKPIISHDFYSDEGAANHNRIFANNNKPGLEIFIYSKNENNDFKSKKYPARQAILSQKCIERNHKIKNVLYVEQNPVAIDAGAFHNDVVCVMNGNVILFHEKAFSEQKNILIQIEEIFEGLFYQKLNIIEISNNLLPIEEAVSSYLFNSQLLSKEDNSMLLFCPMEALINPYSKKTIDYILAQDNPITKVKFFDVKESMDNGGGPACLRLRILLNNEEMKAIKPEVWFNQKIFEEISYIINNFYEEEFYPEKSIDERFLSKTKEAYRAIYEILNFEL